LFILLKIQLTTKWSKSFSVALFKTWVSRTNENVLFFNILAAMIWDSTLSTSAQNVEGFGESGTNFFSLIIFQETASFAKQWPLSRTACGI